MTQTTYLHNQVKKISKNNHFHDHGLFPLPMQNSYSKLIFVCLPIFKKFCRSYKDFRKITIFMIMDYFPCQCKILIQNLFLSACRFSKSFAGPIRTNEDQDFDTKIFFSCRPPHKHFLRKIVIRGKFENFSLFPLVYVHKCYYSRI